MPQRFSNYYARNYKFIMGKQSIKAQHCRIYLKILQQQKMPEYFRHFNTKLYVKSKRIINAKHQQICCHFIRNNAARNSTIGIAGGNHHRV